PALRSEATVRRSLAGRARRLPATLRNTVVPARPRTRPIPRRHRRRSAPGSPACRVPLRSWCERAAPAATRSRAAPVTGWTARRSRSSRIGGTRDLGREPVPALQDELRFETLLEALGEHPPARLPPLFRERRVLLAKPLVVGRDLHRDRPVHWHSS